MCVNLELVANSVSTFPKRPVPDEKCLGKLHVHKIL